MRCLKIGTRKSPLAMKQTAMVIEALQEQDASLTFEVVGISTKGDRMPQANLSQIGGKGVFVKEVEHQLMEREIDFAVHSLKDMPACLPDSLLLAATPVRGNPFDCLVFRQQQPAAFHQLPAHMVIGTSSLRRGKQLQEKYPDWEIVPIRGSVGTRLEKMTAAQMEGTVLAMAGLERVKLLDTLADYMPLTVEQCIPAVGQGILAVECRKEDTILRTLLETINDQRTYQAAVAERTFLSSMNGNCELPLGAYAWFDEELQQWQFHAYLAKSATEKGVVCRLIGEEPVCLANQASVKLLS